MAQDQLPHRLTLSDRNALTMTGVTEVVRFEETAVVLRTVQGDLMIHGQDLKLKTLSLDGGQVVVEGMVTALVYEEPRQSFSWRRFFG